MCVVADDTRALPTISLPSRILRLRPDCMSESSNGITTEDKLERDRERLNSAYTNAQEAFTNLVVSVESSGIDVTSYPQFDTSHLNFLLTSLENNAEECQGHIDTFKDNLRRLAEVEDVDNFGISDDGEIITSENQQIRVTPSNRALIPSLLDVPIESLPGNTSGSSTETVLNNQLGSQINNSIPSALLPPTSLAPLQGSLGSVVAPVSPPNTSSSIPVTTTTGHVTFMTPATGTSLVNSMAQGYSLLQTQQQHQTATAIRCQQDLFNMRANLLRIEANALSTRLSHMPSVATLLSQSLHEKIDNLELKLNSLSSLWQNLVGISNSNLEIQSELESTGAVISAIAECIGAARENLTLKESLQMPSEITQMAVPTITNFLQKLSLPKFSGKISDYPTFKQTFKDLTEGAGYPTSVIVEHLKNVVPKEHHHLIEASTTMTEIWQRLDEKMETEQ